MIKITFELDDKYVNIYKIDNDATNKEERVLEALAHLVNANKEVS